jgi:hypothetical protein
LNALSKFQDDDDDDDDVIRDDRVAGASASEGEDELEEGEYDGSDLGEGSQNSEDEGEGSQASEPSSAHASPNVRRRKPPRAD